MHTQGIKKLAIIFAPLLLVFLLWLISLAVIWVNTARHGHEFTGLYTQTGMISGMQHLRVFRYSENTARVYYFTRNGLGITLDFAMQNGEWELTREHAVWSASGSADDVIWPFVHHSVEGIVAIILFGMAWIVYAIIASVIMKNVGE